MTRREFLRSAAAAGGVLALGSAALAYATPEPNKGAKFFPYPALSFLPLMHDGAWGRLPLLDSKQGPAPLIREVCSTNQLLVPILGSVFRGQLKDRLAGEAPPLLGNYIKQQFDSCLAAVYQHFPGDYSAEQRIRTAADLTVFALAGASFPYFSPEEITASFGVQLPKFIADNAPQRYLSDNAFINLTASQLPHVYPAPASQCGGELDRVLRCYGQIDRNSHFAFHLTIAYWFLKSLGANNSNIARMPNVLSWATKLGGTPSQKAEILEFAVGRGWETLETGKAIEDIFTGLLLMDADQKNSNWESLEKDKKAFLGSLRTFDKTGWLDRFVINDFRANHLGMEVALLFSQAKTISDIEKIRQIANSPFINSVPETEKNPKQNRVSLTAIPVR